MSDDGTDWDQFANEVLNWETLKEGKAKWGDYFNYQLGFRVDKVFKKSFRHEGGLLLDFGCNVGKWVSVARSLGYEYIGLDQSFKALQAARKENKNGSNFIRSLGQFLPFKSSTFDVVMEITVFQHQTNKTKTVMLREIRRVLKHGGTLFLFNGIFEDKPEDYTNDRIFTRKGWIKFTEAYGFKLIQFTYPVFQFQKVDDWEIINFEA